MPNPTSNLGLAMQDTPGRVADGVETELRLTRDGALFTANWYLALLLEGKVWAASFGSQGSAITGVTSAAPLQPSANLDIPTGTAVIPVSFNLTATAMAGTVTNFRLRGGSGLVGAGTSTAVTPQNMNQNFTTASGCTARQAYSGNGAAQTLTVDLFSASALAASGVPATFLWQPQMPMILKGPASINLDSQATTTAPVFYAQLVWIELPSTLL